MKVLIRGCPDSGTQLQENPQDQKIVKEKYMGR